MDQNHPLVKKRETLNPYRWAAYLIYKRAIWDLHPQSWISRKKLRKIKGQYQGEKAVILCNGPSLNKVNFDILRQNCFTFGLNKINLLFNRTVFRPRCVVAVNSFVIEQNKDFYNETDLPLFLDSKAILNRWVRPRSNTIFLHSTLVPGFAKDCSLSIMQGYTVTYVALQIAFHMGFKIVALVGADHTFVTKGPENKIVESGEKDESHFDPNYFAGMKWQLPDLFESEVSYVRARKMYEAHGRKVFNCTEGGRLEIFERLSLQKFIEI